MATNLLDIHTHSISSGHGTHNTIADMAKQAASIGLKALGITDHGPATMGSCKPSYFRSLSLAPKTRAGIRMLYGVELNILDYKGSLDLDNDTLSHLDYAIASIHTQNLKPGSRQENTTAYIEAMKNPYVKMIGHCDDTKYQIDYQALVQAAREYHVLLELNDSSLSPEGYRGDTTENNQQLLTYCMAYDHPLVLSSDSHGVSRVGAISYADAFAKSMNFPKHNIINYNPALIQQWLGLVIA